MVEQTEIIIRFRSGAAENRKDYAWAAGKALRFPRFAEPQLGPAVNGDVDRPFANDTACWCYH